MGISKRDCPTDVILLDGGFLQPPHPNCDSLPDRLYWGIGSLETISTTEVENLINHLSSARYLFDKTTHVLPEVMTEFGIYLTILNDQVSFIGKRLSKRDNRDDGQDHREKVYTLLTQYTKNVYCFQRLMQTGNKFVSFEGNRQRYFDGIYSLVMTQCSDMLARDEIRKSNKRSSKYAKVDLNTDMKIVASALVMSEEQPVTIATRDKYLGVLLDRMGDCINEGLLPPTKNVMYTWTIGSRLGILKHDFRNVVFKTTEPTDYSIVTAS